MKKLLLLSFLFIGVNTIAQEKFQLAPPMLKFSSAFFAGTTSFEIMFNQPGAEIRYTLNGNEPTEKDLLYTGPVIITKRTTVKVKAIGNNFLPSETIAAEFIKDGKAIKQIEFSTPNEFYAKAKKDILHDNIGGFTSFGGGTWLGYNGDSAVITITLQKKSKVRSVLINMLIDEGSWIFLPNAIDLYIPGKKIYSGQPVANVIFTHDYAATKQNFAFELKLAQKLKARQLQLVFSTMKKIPEWHAGKGNHAWFFIDEIKVY